MAKKKQSSGSSPANPSSAKVISKIRSEAESVRKKILAKKTPAMKFPVRSLSNVIYRPKSGYFEMKGRKKERTLTVGTVKTFAQTLRMMAFSKELVESDPKAVKEAVSKEEAQKLKEQIEGAGGQVDIK